MGKKSKKNPEPTNQEQIHEMAEEQHKRLYLKLKLLKPNTPEYDAVLKEIKEFEAIQREKDKVKNSDANSKREHIGKSLITTGGTVLMTTALMGMEKYVPIVGNVSKGLVQKILRK